MGREIGLQIRIPVCYNKHMSEFDKVLHKWGWKWNMGRQYLLAIDVGTTNTKGALFGLDGRLWHLASRKHAVSSPREGWAEHDAGQVWWKEVKEVCRELTANPDVNPKDILSVGVSSLSPALLAVDKAGEALYPAMLYGLDRRAAAEMEELSGKFGENEEPGPVSVLSTGPKILWLKRNEPEIFEKAAYFIGAPSYIVNKLTGNMVADYACYHINGIPFNRNTFDWDDEMCGACGITRERLPRLKWGSEKAGVVTKRAAAETGLWEGCTVAVGTGDFPAESISYGTIYSSWIKISFGTTVGVNFGSDHGRMVFPGYDYLHPRKSIRGGAMSNGCSTIDWMLSVISGEERISNEELQKMADSVPPGANGLTMLPYLNGEKTPFYDPMSKGVLLGLQRRHTKADLYKVSMEALAYSIRQMLEAVPEDRAREAVVLGGGLNIPGLMQIVSDVTGYRLTKLELVNGSLAGDAFIAGTALGIFHELKDIDPWVRTVGTVEPDSGNKRIYDKGYQTYRRLYENTAELMHG